MDSQTGVLFGRKLLVMGKKGPKTKVVVCEARVFGALEKVLEAWLLAGFFPIAVVRGRDAAEVAEQIGKARDMLKEKGPMLLDVG